MKVLNNKELEFKFNAEDIPLTEFVSFAKHLNPLKSLYVCGYDHFYSSKESPNTFIRHRVGQDFNQLTVKRKLVENNNFLRDEINVSLARDVNEETANALAQAMGYEFNTTIFKTVFVYDYEKFTLAYYSVTNQDLKELGRFMEIEMSEDYAWETEEQAWELLKELEAGASHYLGIKPQGRIKKSLFEQFRR